MKTTQPTWTIPNTPAPGLTGAQAQQRLQAITDSLLPAIVAKVKEHGGVPAGGVLLLQTAEDWHHLSCVSYEEAFQRAQERGPATIHSLVSVYAVALAKKKAALLIIYAHSSGGWATASLVLDCAGVVD